ncbi:unnamed protein product [Vicia faba]|uniref:Uncharacterized protein n=1 Tax=Vicia faba TaxID=3906 RepID=A0AAV0YTS6_VICFA|nr:unnamed protein product [Vicia faba]
MRSFADLEGGIAATGIHARDLDGLRGFDLRVWLSGRRWRADDLLSDACFIMDLVSASAGFYQQPVHVGGRLVRLLVCEGANEASERVVAGTTVPQFFFLFSLKHKAIYQLLVN